MPQRRCGAGECAACVISARCHPSPWRRPAQSSRIPQYPPLVAPHRISAARCPPCPRLDSWPRVRPRARLPGLCAEHLHDTSLHRILVQRFGLHPGRGRNRIRAVGADAALAEALRIPAGSPLLMLEGQGFDQHGQPLEWFTTWHRAEKLVFDVDVSPAGEHIHAALPDAAGPAAPQPGGSPASLESVEAALEAALDAVRRMRQGSPGA